MEKLNDGLYADVKAKCKFNTEYDYVKHQLNIEIIDLRSVADQYDGHVAEGYLLSDAQLFTDKWKEINLNKDDIHSMNQVIRLTKSTLTKNSLLGEHIYYTNLDLHTTSNLLLHSSALASYDTVSNFTMETIIKKHKRSC